MQSLIIEAAPQVSWQSLIFSEVVGHLALKKINKWDMI